MIRCGMPPYLECSSKGDKRFSAFYARLEAYDNQTIESIYQAAKVFDGGVTGLSIERAKGKTCTNHKEVSALYVNKLKESTVLKPGGSLEPENKTMKSMFFNEPNYAGSRSKPPQNMRQLRPIAREELCQMVDGKVVYTQLEGTTTTIATCEVVPGFVITGTSATLSPRHYDVSLGETAAYDDIINQLMRLEGYARQRMRYLRVGLSDHLNYGY